MNSTSYLVNITSSSPNATIPPVYDDYDGSNAPCQYSHSSSHVLAALYYVFFLAGLLGNALVIWVIAFGVRLGSMSDVCLLNLAVADLLLVCSLPFLAHQARDQWTFGDAMCKMVLGAYHVGFYSGIFFVLLMSVDRYLALVRAVHVMRKKTRLPGVVMAAAAWTAGLLASFPDLAFLQVQTASSGSGHVLSFCAPQFDSDSATRHFWTVFGLFKMNIIGLLVPMTVMVFCYSRIIRKLQQHSIRSAAKRQSIRLVLVVVAVFFCCWMPYNIASLFKALELLRVYAASSCERSKAIRTALQVTEVIAYSHSCLNPVLYVFVGQKFRGHLVKLMHRALGTLSSLHRASVTANSQPSRSSVDERSTAL